MRYDVKDANIISYKTIGEHIRRAREKKGYTQEKLAEMLGISSQHYGHMERGTRRVSLDLLGKLCVLLSVPLESFLEGAVLDVSFVAMEDEQDTQIAQMVALLKGCPREVSQMALEICKVLSRYQK